MTHQDNNRELVFHLVDWSLASLGVLLSLGSNHYSVIPIILFVSAIVSLILLLKSNNKLKGKLDIYETLLKHSIPLYGILNYISKKSASIVSVNKSLKLDELSLKIKLAGNIDSTKDNDVEFNWSFIGVNTEKKEVGDFFLRIGGDSAATFEELKIKCVDCTIDEASCENRDNISACGINDNCLVTRKINVNIDERISSITLWFLQISFRKKVEQHKPFKFKISYVWPQCYNRHYDFILIDPNNFSPKIEKIRLLVEIDGKVIKPSSEIQLFSIDSLNNQISSEYQVPFINSKQLFEITFEPKNDLIYFITIKN